VSHSNPDRKRGVSECALEGRAAVLLVERPCGISCRFSLFFYVHVCAEQRESQIIEHASDEHRLPVISHQLLDIKKKCGRERPTQKFIYGWILLENILGLTSGEPN